MGIWQKLFGREPNPSTPPATPAPPQAQDEHAVLLHIRLSNDQFGGQGEVQEMHAFQDVLERAIKNANAGELDGDEFGGGECVIYLYGPDADRLWAAVEPAVKGRSWRPGSYAIKRYGGPEAEREERIDL